MKKNILRMTLASLALVAMPLIASSTQQNAYYNEDQTAKESFLKRLATIGITFEQGTKIEKVNQYLQENIFQPHGSYKTQKAQVPDFITAEKAKEFLLLKDEGKEIYRSTIPETASGDVIVLLWGGIYSAMRERLEAFKRIPSTCKIDKTVILGANKTARNDIYRFMADYADEISPNQSFHYYDIGQTTPEMIADVLKKEVAPTGLPFAAIINPLFIEGDQERMASVFNAYIPELKDKFLGFIGYQYNTIEFALAHGFFTSAQKEQMEALNQDMTVVQKLDYMLKDSDLKEVLRRIAADELNSVDARGVYKSLTAKGTTK